MTDLFDTAVAAKLAGGGGGGEAVLKTKTVTANGVYNASSDHADGYSKVTVNVPSPPAPVLIGKNIGANGTYTAAGDNADGYSSVTVAVPTPPPPVLTTKSITENGTYTAAGDNADGYSAVTVAVPTPPPPVLTTKSITENGTYNAAGDSADGYSSVTVAVPMEPLKLCIIDSSYDWKDYSGYLTPAATTHLIRSEDKSSGTRETRRAAACGSIYIPAGETAVIYTDVEGMEVAGWRTTEVGYPYNSEPNWGRGWVSTPATIDNSNSAVPYIFVPHFRYSDDRTLTDDNRPQFCFAEIR